jgi:hypothetical protein
VVDYTGSGGQFDLCIYGSCPTGLFPIPMEPSFDIFPNPACDKLNIHYSLVGGQLEIFDLTGRKFLEKATSPGKPGKRNGYQQPGSRNLFCKILF